MLSQVVGASHITRVEIDLFDKLNAEINRYTQEESFSGLGPSNGRADALPEILETLIASGEISREAMVIFLDIHEILIYAGVMQ